MTGREGEEVWETCPKKFKGQVGARAEGETVSHKKHVICDVKER